MLWPFTNQLENNWIHTHITSDSFRTDLKGFTLYWCTAHRSIPRSLARNKKFQNSGAVSQLCNPQSQSSKMSNPNASTSDGNPAPAAAAQQQILANNKAAQIMAAHGSDTMTIIAWCANIEAI